MNKIKSWFFAAVSILLINNAYSQKSNYIATDSTMISGVKLIRGTAKENAQFIRTDGKNKVINFYPDQIKEYGFKSGEKYKAINISVAGQRKKVFLEEVVQGKITLYYYEEKGIKTYFLDKDSTALIEIPKGTGFRKKISEKTNDFEWKMNQVELVQYKRTSLVKLLSMYNNEYNEPIPYLRFGLNVGYIKTSLSKPFDLSIKAPLNILDFTSSSSVSLGLFVDIPMGISDFSFNAGLNFSNSNHSSYTKTIQSDVDIDVNITSINFPFLFRYTLPTLVWRPFINVGPLYTFHLKNETIIYRNTTNPDVIKSDKVLEQSLVAKNMIGYSVGIGLQRNLNYKNIASIEFRINNLLENKNALNKNQIEILTSFSF